MTTEENIHLSRPLTDSKMRRAGSANNNHNNINNSSISNSSNCLSGYAILPRYKRSTAASTTNNNNNLLEYRQLHDNKHSRRRLPAKKTNLSRDQPLASVARRHGDSSMQAAPVTSAPLPRMRTSEIGGRGDGSSNGDCVFQPRSDGLLAARRKMADPWSDNGREDEEMERLKNPNDVTFLPADKSSSSSVVGQARHPIWPPCQPIDGQSQAVPRPVAWRERPDDHVISMTPPAAQLSLATTDDDDDADASAPTSRHERHERHLPPIDHAADSTTRPSGVIIRKKYTTGLVLGRYESETTAKVQHGGRTHHGQPAVSSPKRRRDVFRDDSVELECHRSDSTTALLGGARKAGGGGKGGGGGGDGCSGLPSKTDSLSSAPRPSESADAVSTDGSTAAAGSVGVRGRREKFLSFLKSFVEFVFSTVGLFCCLIGYVCLGGIIFQRLESPNEMRINVQMRELRNNSVNNLWAATKKLNILHHDNWTRIAEEILENYTLDVFNSVKKLGWDGKEENNNQDLQWSFAGSLLYSITVITTIGYGHIAPKTDLGRIMTMLYAIIGIPLTLLTITNLGGFMATAFRFLYRNICCRLVCVCCRKKTRMRQSRKSTDRQLVLIGRTVTATTIPPERTGRRKLESPTAATAFARRSRSSFSKDGGEKSLSFWKKRKAKRAESEGENRNHSTKSKAAAAAAIDDLEPTESRRLPWRERFEDIFNTDDIKQVKVPILVSLLLITGYIGLGALLFSFWEEDWSYLIGCYFCFVTLSTIGFGDYVPGTGADDWNNQAKLVLCAMYLFVGLALIAMCFDLMLEQVRARFRQIGRCIGILDDGGKRKKLKVMAVMRGRKRRRKRKRKMEDETEEKITTLE